MQPTLDNLTASPTPVGVSRPPVKPKQQRPPKHPAPPPPTTAFVDLDAEGDDESEVPLSRPRKRLVCSLQMATESITPAGNSRSPTQCQPNMVEVTANQGTRQRGRGLQVQVELTSDHLPSRSVLHRSSLAARPQIGLLSCPLRLQYHMRQWILLGHLSLLCRLPRGQKMLLHASGRIVTIFMSKLRVRPVRP